MNREAQFPSLDLPSSARVWESGRQAKQAERLAAIGQMAAVLAHEGRNSLQHIAVSHALLSMEVQDRAEAENHLREAEKARHGLVRLFDDLCCYAGMPSLCPSVRELSSIWRKVWADQVASRQGRTAELLEETHAVSLKCEIDRFRLEQVFRNLFDNALAACPDPVRVVVCCSEATHNERPALRLELRDNGPGLSPEQRQKVFEPFYTTKSSGTGLGLAICKQIIEAHGGAMSLGDDSGGAAFIIVLPRGGETVGQLQEN